MSIEATQEQSPELYLIAHKVRGEPAFDVAYQLQIGDEEGWIIPTSGHRAYPYWFAALENIDDTYQLDFKSTEFWIDASRNIKGSMNGPGPMPPNWPDHYSINDRKHYQAVDEEYQLAFECAPSGTGLTNLADALGFTKPKFTTPIRRI